MNGFPKVSIKTEARDKSTFDLPIKKRIPAPRTIQHPEGILSPIKYKKAKRRGSHDVEPKNRHTKLLDAYTVKNNGIRIPRQFSSHHLTYGNWKKSFVQND